ncbi:MAG: DsrE family protein [Betaproteobacteria bacterium]|nr:DsrE family protein [Betaproteobacteria bacterium]
MNLLSTAFRSLAAFLVAATVSFAYAASADDPVKIVYHFDAGFEQATKGLRNIKNHLDVEPKTKIVVVAHAQGVNFLLDGATNATGNPYNIPVEELAGRGVEFRVCEITLKSNKIDPKKLLPQTKLVPSGVVEIGKLQAKEGFAYLKP